MSSPTTISIKEILDFISCPTLYDYRYIRKEPIPQPKVGRPTKNSVVELYDEAIHKAMFYLFHRIQDGVFPSVANLAKTWGNVWTKPRSDHEDIRFKSVSWRDTHHLKEKQGWEHLKRARAYYESNHGTPIMVDYQYAVPIGKDIVLTGNIDLVEVVGNDRGQEQIILTEFLTDERNMPHLNIRRDWKVTAAAYAFRKLMKVNEQKIVYHGIVSGKRHDTVRDDGDFKQLEHLIAIIVAARSQGLFYPVLNDRCSTCPYQKLCEKGWFHAEN